MWSENLYSITKFQKFKQPFSCNTLEEVIEHFRIGLEKHYTDNHDLLYEFKQYTEFYRNYYERLTDFLRYKSIIKKEEIKKFIAEANSFLKYLFIVYTNLIGVEFLSHFSKSTNETYDAQQAIFQYLSGIVPKKLILEKALKILNEIYEINAFPWERNTIRLLDYLDSLNRVSIILHFSLVLPGDDSAPIPDYSRMNCIIFKKDEKSFLRLALEDFVSTFADKEEDFKYSGCKKLLLNYPFLFHYIRDYEYDAVKDYFKYRGMLRELLIDFYAYLNFKNWLDDFYFLKKEFFSYLDELSHNSDIDLVKDTLLVTRINTMATLYFNFKCKYEDNLSKQES